MYCSNCGNEINDNAVVCIHCGCPVVKQNPVVQQPVAKSETNVLAIIGFVMAFLMPLAGLICSILGYKHADRDYNGNQKGLALAGTIISAITLVAVVAVVIWAIAWYVIAIVTITAPYA